VESGTDSLRAVALSTPVETDVEAVETPANADN
jgi:hypothetical protein